MSQQIPTEMTNTQAFPAPLEEHSTQASSNSNYPNIFIPAAVYDSNISPAANPKFCSSNDTHKYKFKWTIDCGSSNTVTTRTPSNAASSQPQHPNILIYDFLPYGNPPHRFTAVFDEKNTIEPDCLKVSIDGEVTGCDENLEEVAEYAVALFEIFHHYVAPSGLEGRSEISGIDGLTETRVLLTLVKNPPRSSNVSNGGDAGSSKDNLLSSMQVKKELVAIKKRRSFTGNFAGDRSKDFSPSLTGGDVITRSFASDIIDSPFTKFAIFMLGFAVWGSVFCILILGGSLRGSNLEPAQSDAELRERNSITFHVVRMTSSFFYLAIGGIFIGIVDAVTKSVKSKQRTAQSQIN